MAKLKAKDNVLARFLSQQNLPEREQFVLKSCGSDGVGLYIQGRYLINIKHIESISIETIPKRLLIFQDMSIKQAAIILMIIWTQPFWWPHLKDHLPEGLFQFVLVLWFIYAVADVLVWYVKHRGRPKQHYQLTLHTRFGEKHIFAHAEEETSLLLLENWLWQASEMPSDPTVKN